MNKTEDLYIHRGADPLTKDDIGALLKIFKNIVPEYERGELCPFVATTKIHDFDWEPPVFHCGEACGVLFPGWKYNYLDYDSRGKDGEELNYGFPYRKVVKEVGCCPCYVYGTTYVKTVIEEFLRWH